HQTLAGPTGPSPQTQNPSLLWWLQDHFRVLSANWVLLDLRSNLGARRYVRRRLQPLTVGLGAIGPADAQFARVIGMVVRSRWWAFLRHKTLPESASSDGAGVGAHKRAFLRRLLILGEIRCLLPRNNQRLLWKRGVRSGLFCATCYRLSIADTNSINRCVPTAGWNGRFADPYSATLSTCNRLSFSSTQRELRRSDLAR